MRLWYRGLYAIESSKISVLLFLRVAVAVGVPLFGFALAGHVAAGVAGGASAMFVAMSDIGTRRRDRVGMMIAATALILIGGFIGDKFGGTTRADEGFIVVSALVAGWVSNSQPGISAIARFGALATAAGAGMQIHDPLAAVAVAACAAARRQLVISGAGVVMARRPGAHQVHAQRRTRRSWPPIGFFRASAEMTQ